jgi:hypothetical protein
MAAWVVVELFVEIADAIVRRAAVVVVAQGRARIRFAETAVCEACALTLGRTVSGCGSPRHGVRGHGPSRNRRTLGPPKPCTSPENLP